MWGFRRWTTAEHRTCYVAQLVGPRLSNWSEASYWNLLITTRCCICCFEDMLFESHINLFVNRMTYWKHMQFHANMPYGLGLTYNLHSIMLLKCNAISPSGAQSANSRISIWSLLPPVNFPKLAAFCWLALFAKMVHFEVSVMNKAKDRR